MQRAQRGVDNHAVDLAVRIANLLALPLVVYFAAISNFPHANLRHYVFLNQGLPDIEADLAARNISFVMRRAPHESHELRLRLPWMPRSRQIQSSRLRAIATSTN